MPKPHDHWKVLPHGPLTQISDNLYTVTGRLRMPLGESTRRMTLVRLRGGRLAIYSAIALDETEMQKVEALGTPTFLIVPSDVHRLDVKGWKQRYPAITVLAPEGAREKVSEIVPVDASQLDLGDPRVQLMTVSGTGDREFAMTVSSESGTTLIVNDLIFNFPEIPGFAGAMLRLLGFGPGAPSMPKLVRMKLIEDTAAVRSQLEDWASRSDLERLLVSHGAPIDNPRETLRKLAGALA